MSAFISCGMIYLGSILMAYNIVQYVRFSGNIRTKGDWKQERQILQFPIVLLVLFLAGYLAVALFGHPDLVIASILLGGSIWLQMKQAGQRLFSFPTCLMISVHP